MKTMLTDRAQAVAIKASKKTESKNKITRLTDQEIDKITDKILFTQYYNSTDILK